MMDRAAPKPPALQQGAIGAMLRPPNSYWLLALLLVVTINFAWAEVTRTRGAQKVSFVPAELTCGEAGPLRYCINRDRRGTNGDILYHPHARNLDETIWNDDTYMTALIQAEWQRSQALLPTVITVSYEPTWMLAPKGEKPDSGLLDDFMARQALKADHASGLVSDANAYANLTIGKPNSTFDLGCRVITVSLRTLKIVKGVPVFDLKEGKGNGMRDSALHDFQADTVHAHSIHSKATRFDHLRLQPWWVSPV